MQCCVVVPCLPARILTACWLLVSQVEDSRKAEAMQKYAPPSFRPGAQGSVKSEGALEAGKGGSSSGAPLLTNKGKCAPSVAAGAAGKGADETGGGLASVPFVALCITCVMVYSAVLPFNNIASALLLDRDFFPHGTRWRDANNDTFVYDQARIQPSQYSPPTAVNMRFALNRPVHRPLL